tara:strand:+ start:582 stop:1265 length:684 start_codon:yes stop_codon:yes gene_type:complete
MELVQENNIIVLDALLNGNIINIMNIGNYINKLKLFLKQNLKVIIILLSTILLIFVLLQIYSYFQNKNILDASIRYNFAKNSDSIDEFNKTMIEISKENNFYGLLASMELINNKIQNKNYNESFNDYFELLNKKNISEIYKTLISIHASYNLIGKIDNNKISELLNFYNDKFDQFLGNYLEILFLLSLLDNNANQLELYYDQIIKHEEINPSLKDRIKKIYNYEKYK